MKKIVSIKKPNVILKRKGFISSKTSVYRILKSLDLKWYKKKKAQKLSDIDKTKRVIYAKALILKFDIKKNSNK